MMAKTDGTHILAALAAAAAIYLGSTMLIPILLACFLFVLLDPLANWGEHRRIPRKVSAPVLILLFMGISGLIGRGGYGTFATLTQQLPQYSQKIRGLVSSVQKKADTLQKGTDTLLPKSPPKDDVQKVEVVQQPGGDSWTRFLLGGLNSVFAIVTASVLIPILALFLLLEKSYLGSSLSAALGPNFSLEPIHREISQMVRGFFLGNLVVGAITSVGFFILFSILHLENRLALAIFSGFVNLIPILGAVLGALLPAVQAVLQFDTAGPVLIILVTSVLLHFFVANVVIPKVVGTRINVNATAATIGFIFWGWCWGGVGLLLAVPLMALVRIFLAAKPATRAWANLIAESPNGPVTRLSLSLQSKN